MEALLDATRARATEEVIPTLCHGCGSYKPHCGILCHVRDGRFVRVEGNPGRLQQRVPGSTSLCAKGLTGPQYVYAADRLKYPLKRVGAKGEGKFQRITWDEALDTIADKLKETKAEVRARILRRALPRVLAGARYAGPPLPERARQPQLHAQRHLRDAAHGRLEGHHGLHQHGAGRLEQDQADRQLGRQRGELRRQPGHPSGHPERPGRAERSSSTSAPCWIPWAPRPTCGCPSDRGPTARWRWRS